MATIICRLPNGLVATVGKQTVEFAGAKTSELRAIHGAIPEGAVGLTEVSDEFADAFFKEFAEAAFIKNGAVTRAANAAGAKAKARSEGVVKTGLEGMDANKPMPGITKATAA